MNNIEYNSKASRTLPDLGSLELNLCHMILGLNSEIGELVNCIGTELKHNPDIPNLKEEIGDLYWYLGNYCNIQNIAPPQDIVNFLESHRCIELLISSVGELTDVVKKFIAYKKEIDRADEMDAVYNIYSALDLLQHIYALNGDEIRVININRLLTRYPEKFSNEKALNRNLEAERKTLEN